jgi:hypothetical protein
MSAAHSCARYPPHLNALHCLKGHHLHATLAAQCLSHFLLCFCTAVYVMCRVVHAFVGRQGQHTSSRKENTVYPTMNCKPYSPSVLSTQWSMLQCLVQLSLQLHELWWPAQHGENKKCVSIELLRGTFIQRCSPLNAQKLHHITSTRELVLLLCDASTKVMHAKQGRWIPVRCFTQAHGPYDPITSESAAKAASLLAFFSFVRACNWSCNSA